jgi:hypothetical protein
MATARAQETSTAPLDLQWPAGAEVVTLGSAEEATFRLEGASARPFHAVLVRDPSARVMVVALVAGGVLIRGRSVGRAVVEDGELLEVAGIALRLHLPLGGGSPLLVARTTWGSSLLEVTTARQGGLLKAPALLRSVGDGPKPPPRIVARHHAERGWLIDADLPWTSRDGVPLDVPEVEPGWAPLPLEPVRWARGPLTCELSLQAPPPLPRVTRAPWWSSPAAQQLVIFAMVAVTLLAMLLNPPEHYVPQGAEVVDRIANARTVQVAAPDQSLEKVRQRAAEKRSAEAVAERTRGAEGRAGRPEATSQARRGTRAIDQVQRNALIRALSGTAATRAVSGGSLSAADAVGQLAGERVGDGSGLGGLGRGGFGSGGGGVGSQTVGVGPVGSRGGIGAAAGAGRIGRGSASDLSLEAPAQVSGGLDREVIRRVVVSHRAQIRYCYEKRLAARPELAGKLLVEFVIGADGSVSSARASEDSLQDPEVGRCVVAKVRGWSFPKPSGGGVVVVTYPFLFQASGRGAE